MMVPMGQIRRVFYFIASYWVGAFIALPSTLHAQAMMNANMNGLYLGGHLGVGIGSAGNTTTTGMLGGVQAGYNIQYNSFLIGPEVDVTASGLHAKGYLAGSYKQNFVSSVKGRLGYVSGNLMVGIMGGFAYTTLAYHDLSGFSDKSVNGYVGGLNVSYILTDKITLRADALRYDFGRPVFSTHTTTYLPLQSNTNLIRAGFDYRL
jgi:outer membrane immunogenic protein